MLCIVEPSNSNVHWLPQVLLFPGGAREVNKKVGEEYKLFWKDSPGAACFNDCMAALCMIF
jgi:hypothetical protein